MVYAMFDPKQVLARRIRERRKTLRIRQGELVSLIGVSQSQVSRYEKAENDATGEILIKLASALNTSTDWLLGLTDAPTRPVYGEADLDDLEREAVELLRGQNEESRKRIVNAIRALV